MGSFLLYKQGGQGHPAYNFAANVFAPEKRAVWGDTVLVVLPHSGGPEGEVLKVSSLHGCQQQQQQQANIVLHSAGAAATFGWACRGGARGELLAAYRCQQQQQQQQQQQEKAVAHCW